MGGWETVIVGSLSTSFHAIRKRGEGIRIRRGKERKKKKKKEKRRRINNNKKKKTEWTFWLPQTVRHHWSFL